MLFARDRLPVPAGLLPAPAPLPSLRDALQRRRALFGPCEPDEPPAAPLGLLARCAAVLRGVADLLEPAPSRINSLAYERKPAAGLEPARVMT